MPKINGLKVKPRHLTPRIYCLIVKHSQFQMNNRLDLALIDIGEPLVEWKLEAIFGDAVPTIDSYLGQPLLILFFNLGCPGCLGRAIPYANRLVYESNDKINVLGIHTNFEGVDFAKEHFEQAKEILEMIQDPAN